MKSILLAAVLAAVTTSFAVAQDQPRNKDQVKAEGRAEQERIKAHTKIDKALTKEAQENVKADAEADKKKLKAHQKAQKKVNEAVADVNKADTKAAAAAAPKK